MKLRVSIDLIIDETGVRLAPAAWTLLERPPGSKPVNASDALRIAEQICQMPASSPPPTAAAAAEAPFDPIPAATTRGNLMANVELPGIPQASDGMRPAAMRDLERLGYSTEKAARLLSDHGTPRIVKVLDWLRTKMQTQAVARPDRLLESVLARPA